MQLITVKDVAAKLSISVSGVWAMVKKDSGFPQPFKLSTKRTRWKEHEVENYLNSIH